MAHAYPLLSEASRVAVAQCPKCHSRDIKGPHDTERSAQFLFTRAYFCRSCWWDKEVRMKDDIAERHAKEAALARKNEEAKRRKRGAAGSWR